MQDQQYAFSSQYYSWGRGHLDCVFALRVSDKDQDTFNRSREARLLWDTDSRIRSTKLARMQDVNAKPLNQTLKRKHQQKRTGNEKTIICKQKWMCLRNTFFWNENVLILKPLAKQKCFWNRSKIVLLFDMFFVVFQKMPETFLGWHVWATIQVTINLLQSNNEQQQN